MPCRYDNYEPSASEVMRGKLDKLTRMLCFVMTHLEKNRPDSFEYIIGRDKGELYQWWLEHQEADKKRLSDEKKAEDIKNKKSKALKKLTKEERDLLGI